MADKSKLEPARKRARRTADALEPRALRTSAKHDLARALRLLRSPASVVGDEARVTAARTLMRATGAVPPPSSSPALQKKVVVGSADDAQEREADDVARRVASGNDAGLSAPKVSGGAPAVRPRRGHRERTEEPVQLRRRPAEVGPTGGAIEEPALAQRVANPGPGRPLPEATRTEMERSFGTDFFGVRVHDGERDRDDAARLGARAFTVGEDVTLGPGESPSDRSLIAHELTHVVQNRGGAAAVSARRAGGAPSGTKPAPAGDDPGVVDEAAKQIVFQRIELPNFKIAGHRGALYEKRKKHLRRSANFKRGSEGNTQRKVWKDKVSTQMSAVRQALLDKVTAAHGGVAPNAAGTHWFQAPSRHKKAGRLIVGSLDTVVGELSLPSWDRKGEPRSLHVDHIVELQLANWAKDKWANTIENMELLDGPVNSSSGSVLKASIERKVNGFRAAHGREESTAAIKARYDLVFLAAVGGGGGKAAKEDDSWSSKDIAEGAHLGPVAVADPSKLGGAGKVELYPSHSGGIPKSFPLPTSKLTKADRGWLKPYRIQSLELNTAAEAVADPAFGRLTFNIPADHDVWKPLAEDQPVEIRRIPGARFAGSIEKSTVRAALAKLRHKRMSPVELHQFDLGSDGIVLSGQILPDLPLLGGSGIEFRLEGDDLRFEKTFTVEDVKVPRPFVVSASSLTLAAGTKSGLSVSGDVAFAIERVGKGKLEAHVGTDAGLAVRGSFDFDSTLFDPARLEVGYENEAWFARGQLGIQKGKVRGIRSASVEVAYVNGILSATGTVEPSFRGIRQGTLQVTYGEEQGLRIGGSVELSNDLPGLKGGQLAFDLSRRPEGDGWVLRGTGSARFGVPGITADVQVEYDDGAFAAMGTVAYEKGIVRGSLTAGATNRALDDAGRPTGPATETITAFGKGSATVRLTEWLQGTVGLELKPNGELVVSGKVELPDAIDLFDVPPFKRELKPIGLDIPIVGVAVAGKRVGIFASVRGGLGLEASVGPGQLQKLELGVVFNPDRPEETRIDGGAKLVVPAEAMLRLFVRGSIGAGVLVVSAEAGLEVGGGLGFRAAFEADTNVEWTPTKGLQLSARAALFAEPVLRFDVKGFVTVELDYLVGTEELYGKTWNLKEYSLGSGMRFGVEFPVRYEEGTPFRLSLDDLKFTRPEIDAKKVLSELFNQIT